MGAYTYTKLERVVIARYFTFTVISQLIIFTIIGVIFSGLPFLAPSFSTHDGDDYSIESVLEMMQALRIQKVTLKIIFDDLTGMIFLH
jgi:hypothetical protein